MRTEPAWALTLPSRSVPMTMEPALACTRARSHECSALDRSGINTGIKTRTVRHRHTHARCLRPPRPDTSESLTPHESDLTDTHYGAVSSDIQKRLQELIGLDSDRAPHSQRGHHAQRGGQVQGEVW